MYISHWAVAVHWLRYLFHETEFSIVFTAQLMYTIINCLFKHFYQLRNLQPAKLLQPTGGNNTVRDVGVIFSGVSQDLLRRAEKNQEIPGTQQVDTRRRIELSTHRIWRSTNQWKRYFVGRDLKGSGNSLFYSGVPNDPMHQCKRPHHDKCLRRYLVNLQYKREILFAACIKFCPEYDPVIVRLFSDYVLGIWVIQHTVRNECFIKSRDGAGVEGCLASDTGRSLETLCLTYLIT